MRDDWGDGQGSRDRLTRTKEDHILLEVWRGRAGSAGELASRSRSLEKPEWVFLRKSKKKKGSAWVPGGDPSRIRGIQGMDDRL